jgi:hypothetical protein
MVGGGIANAWVESPLQLICAVEYAFATHTPVRIVPRAGAAQLPATAARLRELDLPTGVTIEAPRALPVLGASHWIVGDAFSGMTRSAIAMRMPHRLTIVDDGAETLRLPSVLNGSARLSRSTDPLAVQAIADLATTRVRELDARGALELFSYYALDHGARVPNRFRWLRSRGLTSSAPRRIVLGAAAVTDGHLTESAYLDWLRGLATPAHYFPHRRESANLLARVAEIEGLVVEAPGLPIELVLAGAREVWVASLPSSAVETLRIVLLGSGSTIEVSESRVAA